jgi:tetratricopeptide (TPR) repeat protein
MTLAGTALAAAGDTAQVRALADSVERVGSSSSFGRDFKLHFFLRGLLLQHENRHGEAVNAFRRSLFSLTDGYTRINLEMGRSLMALQRYPEAIAILQPALRGGVDGSNTYVTHTELHEALAQAFAGAGRRDSAAVHYAAVERAWRFADPQFSERYHVAKRYAAHAN